MKHVQIILLLIIVAILFTCSHSTSPGSSGSGMTINSINTQSALPASVIAISGTGFGSTGALAARFSNSSGYHVDVQALTFDANSAIVSVPPFVIAGTEKFGPGVVDVQLIRNAGLGETRSNTVAGFRILDLPTPSSSDGSVTLNLLNNLIGYYDTLRAKITDTSTAGSSLIADIQTNQTNLKTLALQVQAVVTNPSTSLSLGSVNGKALTVGSKDLLQTDRMILGMFEALRGSPAALSSGSAKAMAGMSACQQEANDYTDFLLSSAVEGGSSDPRYGAYQNCVTTASVLAIPDAFSIVAGIGTSALGILTLAGAPEMALALPEAALLYVKEMTAGIQIAIGAQLKNVNDTAARIALHNGIAQAEDVVLDPVKSAVVNTLFSETAGNIKDICDGLESVKEAFNNSFTPAGACTVTLSPQSQTFDSSADNGIIGVTAPAGCAWTAASTADWIAITDGGSTGSGTVLFSVQANTGTSQRTGTISVEDKSFTVAQNGKNGSSTSVPTGFPADIPVGTYAVTVTTNWGGTQPPFTATDTSLSAFAQSLVTSMGTLNSQLMTMCQQAGCTCNPSISYSAWNGASFTVIGTVDGTSCSAAGTATTTYTVTKQQ